MAEPPALRVSDAEREDVVGALRAAAGEGRLTLEELSERVESAYVARTDADLAVLLEDLPQAAPGLRPAPVRPATLEEADEGTDWVVAVMGGAERKGRWRLGRHVAAVAVMGGVELDLREAQITAPEVRITTVSIMGGVEVYVPEGVDVQCSGFSLMGGTSGPRTREPLPPGAPVVRIRAFNLMGGTDIRRRKVREIVAEKREERRARRRHLGH